MILNLISLDRRISFYTQLPSEQDIKITAEENGYGLYKCHKIVELDKLVDNYLKLLRDAVMRKDYFQPPI